jgi:2-keto-3-deoxy-L-rhamnonate aldolase RhmA
VFPASLVSLPAFLVLAAAFSPLQAQRHLNPVIDLLADHRPVLGIYAPRSGGGRGGRGGAPPADAPAPKTPAELAREALSYKNADFLFDGSMEGDFDRAFPVFAQFVEGLTAAGGIVDKTRAPRLTHALIIKTHKIADDPKLAAERIGRQLDLGVSGIMFPEVESADEVKAGLAAMRFASKGGTRPDGVGNAPAVWGMSEKQYRDRADLWPLNPKGELINWTIVESKEGLKHVREIAAVKGIGVLWPGAGTLSGVFSSTDPVTGRRVRDDAAWEAAIQQVLAACKEFNVPCGFPANTPDVMEMRAKQGFTVFVSGWGENGFATIDAGHKLGRKE